MGLPLALAASSLALLLAVPALAAAQLTWNGPVGADSAGNGPSLTSVACPSTTECVAVDTNGGEVTFNPSAPTTQPATAIDSYYPTSVACVSTTTCVAVDAAGQAVIFNPADPASAQATSIDSGALFSVSCLPGATSCSAVDDLGNEVTFNTSLPADPQVVCVDPGQSQSAGPCTSADPGESMYAVSCPVAGQCTAVDASGSYVSFDPQTQAFTKPSGLESGTALTALSCTSTSQCVAFDSSGTGTEIIFNPSGGGLTSTTLEPEQGQDIAGVACATGPQCTVIDSAGGEDTFYPEVQQGVEAGTATNPRSTITSNTPTSIACPSASLCVAVDSAGHEISFDPGASAPSPTSARIDGRPSYSVVSCPTATQCTGIDSQGYEATFNPTSSAPPSTAAAVDPNGVTIYSISCPSTIQCTAVDLRGQEVTFNPQNPGTPSPVALVNNHYLLSVACPSTTQCTAVDDDEYEVTFNPQAPTTGSYASLGTQSESNVTSVSCPSTTQCTAVDAVGEQATFNPQNPGTPKPTTVLPDGAVAVSCPTAARCVAIDLAGVQVTFDPTDPVPANSATVDSSQPSALACPGATFCVAIDVSGHAVEFDPGGTGATTSDSVGSGGALNDLACVSVGECVTVDSTGHAFVGQGSVPLPPVAASPPRIAGVLKQGDTLQETHGGWSGSPTSYAYQWERCTTANSCTPIVGAIGESYQLVAADDGDLIRVSEQAADAGGFGAPVVSAATAKVTGLPAAPAFSRIKLTGVAAGRVSLKLTLKAAPYGPKLRDWTLSLPRVLTVHLRSIGARRDGRWRGISIIVNGTQQRFSAHFTREALMVGLKPSVGSLRMTIGSGALTASKSLIRSARHHRRTTLEFKIAVRTATKQLLNAKQSLRLY